MKKTQSKWGDAHIRLRRLYDERAGVSQQEFAERHGFGTQGMVWQYLSGHRPLNYEAAAKFAKALGCKIDDFSPEMAAALREEILPVLGKILRRAAVVLLALLLQQFASPDANAALSHNVFSGRLFSHNSLTQYTLCRFRRWLSAMSARLDIFQRIFGEPDNCLAG